MGKLKLINWGEPEGPFTLGTRTKFDVHQMHICRVHT